MNQQKKLFISTVIISLVCHCAYGMKTPQKTDSYVENLQHLESFIRNEKAELEKYDLNTPKIISPFQPIGQKHDKNLQHLEHSIRNEKAEIEKPDFNTPEITRLFQPIIQKHTDIVEHVPTKKKGKLFSSHELPFDEELNTKQSNLLTILRNFTYPQNNLLAPASLLTVLHNEALQNKKFKHQTKEDLFDSSDSQEDSIPLFSSYEEYTKAFCTDIPQKYAQMINHLTTQFPKKDFPLKTFLPEAEKTITKIKKQDYSDDALVFHQTLLVKTNKYVFNQHL